MKYQNIGLIGTGILGSAIAERLINQKVSVNIYNRTLDKAKKLENAGAKLFTSPKDLYDNSDLVFLCLSGENALTSILFSREDAITRSTKQTKAPIIDLSTIGLKLALFLSENLTQYHIDYLDCPVSGGCEGAINGVLTAICSGKEHVFNSAKDIISHFAKDIFYVGQNGKAQVYKVLNNLAESINLLCAAEVITLGLELDCSLKVMRDVFLSARGGSTYMRLLFNKLIDDSKSVDVSMSTRCKDLELANQLSNYMENNFSSISKITNVTFEKIMKEYGENVDQTKCFDYILKKFEKKGAAIS